MASSLGSAFLSPGQSATYAIGGLGFNVVINFQPTNPGTLQQGTPTAVVDNEGNLSFLMTVTNAGNVGTNYNILGAWDL